MKKGSLVLIASALILTFASCDRYQLEPNDSISLANDAYEGPKNEPLHLDVLTNDELSGRVTVELSNPEKGTISIGNGSSVFTYTPANNFVGVDVFSYEVCSNSGECKSAQISVNIVDTEVEECLKGLTAVDDIIAMDINAKIIFPIKEHILDNDIGCEGDILVENFIVSNHTTNGHLERDGEFIYYTPDQGFKGVDRFQYVIKSESNKLLSRSAFVVFYVGVEPPPIF